MHEVSRGLIKSTSITELAQSILLPLIKISVRLSGHLLSPKIENHN